MSPGTVLFTLATIVLLGNSAAARDERGFWMGGGVGSVGCPEFLNAMATARKKGGLASVLAYGKLLHSSTTSLDSKLALTPKQMASMTSLNHSGTMRPIAFSPQSSHGARVILTKRSQAACWLLRKVFEIN